MRSSVLILLYLCSCQYLGVEAQKDSATLTRVAPTKYEQHIDAINTCLKSGGGQELSDEQKQAMVQQWQEEDKQQVETIDAANYGRICADYARGTIESEQVRRCRYKLDIYPLALIKNCVQAARDHVRLLEEQVRSACQAAKDAGDSITPEQEQTRQLARLCLFQKLKQHDCSQAAQLLAQCGG